MSALNLDKFHECLSGYRKHCERTFWTRGELSKFYFANLLIRNLRLTIQDSATILEVCKRLEERDFYHKTTDSKICGIQFLIGCGQKKFSEPLTAADAQLFKDLVTIDWDDSIFDYKKISFNALSGWLGTLLPYDFMPVTSNHFRHTIAYLFDLELKIYQEEDYDYFVHSQLYFNLTKNKLQEYNLDSLYLKEISEYIKFNYPKSLMKREYEEHDWNWITQDFHLFVYQEILALDTVSRIPLNINNGEEHNFESLSIEFQKSELINI